MPGKSAKFRINARQQCEISLKCPAEVRTFAEMKLRSAEVRAGLRRHRGQRRPCGALRLGPEARVRRASLRASRGGPALPREGPPEGQGRGPARSGPEREGPRVADRGALNSTRESSVARCGRAASSPRNADYRQSSYDHMILVGDSTGIIVTYYIHLLF